MPAELQYVLLYFHWFSFVAVTQRTSSSRDVKSWSFEALSAFKLDLDIAQKIIKGYTYRMDDLRSPAGWLPVHRDQLRVQRSVSSMGSLCKWE